MNKTGFSAADILLPANGDYEHWAVVACDQFTSQPEYWERVEAATKDIPSTSHLILPEAQLSDGHTEEHIETINQTMEDYLQRGIFKEYQDAMVYLERTQSDGHVRRGLIGKIDLEEYDYSPDSDSLIRATEGTVLDRIPPRQAVRRNAPLELPHIMLLVDDPEDTLIGPLAESTQKLYDFDLMEGGGHAKGYLLSDAQKQSVQKALSELAEGKPFLFSVGDGNHSLASAKAHYEEEKSKGLGTPDTLRSRYALVEVVNLYDEALEFEPIHRVLFDVDPSDVLSEMKKTYPNIHTGEGEGHMIGFVCGNQEGILTIPDPQAQLEVGTLQTFLDDYLLDDYLSRKGGRIDYIHGDETVQTLGREKNRIAFLLPAMDKHDLFRSIAADGPLPRKTFSMGHAEDKRYYIEGRRIK